MTPISIKVRRFKVKPILDMLEKGALVFHQHLFLCCLRSIAAHRDHFVRRLSVCSVCLSVRLSVR